MKKTNETTFAILICHGCFIALSTPTSMNSLPNLKHYNFIFIEVDGFSYLLWSREFQSIFVSTDLTVYVDGTVKGPSQIQ